MQRRYQFDVAREHQGYRILDYLVLQMPYFADNTIKKMFHRKAVQVNNRDTFKNQKLQDGDRIKIIIPSGEESEYPTKLRKPPILHETEDFLVVNKPAGITVIQERWSRDSYFKDSIAEYLKENGEEGEPRIVHRIDKDTSGAIIIAKNREMQRILSRLFEERKIEKEYLAIVSGIPPEEGRIEKAIEQISKRSNQMTISEFGKPAITNYWLLENFRDFALIKVKIETGRTHQIRVHMAAEGHPLAIDPMYGYREMLCLSDIKSFYRKKRRNEKALMSRLSLHAHRVSFRLPDTEELITVEAPIADDFELLLKMLRKYRS